MQDAPPPQPYGMQGPAAQVAQATQAATQAAQQHQAPQGQQDGFYTADGQFLAFDPSMTAEAREALKAVMGAKQ